MCGKEITVREFDFYKGKVVTKNQQSVVRNSDFSTL